MWLGKVVRWQALGFLTALGLTGCNALDRQGFSIPTPTPSSVSTSATPHVFNFQFADGGTTNGINYAPTRFGKMPKMAVMNGNLYATWREDIDGNSHDQIRVARYNGGASWTFVDPATSGTSVTNAGLNTNTGVFGGQPSIYASGGSLYVSWHESSPNYPMVKKWDGSTWTFLTTTSGTPASGHLAIASSDTANNTQVIVVNGNVYASWSENNLIHIYKYTGNGTTTTWASIEPANGTLNVNASSTAAGDAVLATDGTNLFASWTESNGTANQIRVAKYNGTSWTYLDGGSTNGINVSPSVAAGGSTINILNGNPIVAWGENNLLVAKAYSNGVWTRIDGSGWNYNTAYTANGGGVVTTAVLNNKFYIAWQENNSGGYAQVRIREFDGTSSRFIDGGSVNQGLNFSAADSMSYIPSIAAYNGGLMVCWAEVTANGQYQIRMKYSQ